MNDLISVIVLTYNSGKTVIETLESIKNQVYQNIEIVIADDSSSDNTLEVVREWQDKNQICKMQIVTTNKNTGVPANCNRGVNACSSSLIKIIAGDDLLEPDAIDIYYKNYLEKGDMMIGMGKVKLFGNPTSLQTEYCCESYKLVQLSHKEQLHKMLVSNYIVSPSVGILNKDMILKEGGFNESFPAFEDYPFYLKLLDRGFSFYLIDKVLVDYRIVNTSMSNGMSKRYMTSMSDYFFLEKSRLLIKHRRFMVLVKQIVRYFIMKSKCN
ncbi:hypothetical protein BXO88_01330 [Oribacterium sp. C9]|uniref:glycosyltransferase family 2 protein n=1 Tax=Oribacterium sp. C9 TaxID=1943579 RepID=UPI00098E8FDC|nr:glycosyltransferase [Oribacterium sp. C9]OON88462.1 hypothetical protein BXO88_01330 [Oribacterium sp. C9]